MEPQKVNRFKRQLDLMEANAKLATPNSWALDHGHVVSSARVHSPRGRLKDAEGQTYDVVSFDVAMAPWERGQAVRGVHPQNRHGMGQQPFADMRHIATCDPRKILDQIALTRELLNVLDDVSATAETLYLQALPVMVKDDVEPRRRLIEEARAICDRLLRPENAQE